ncbi:MAG: hypothetical protein C0592_10660 [Marinilabiliales bacterium]|nr:MAG: hypothetical protein C0592_10660 [Marinilabiliales bacterium]
MKYIIILLIAVFVFPACNPGAKVGDEPEKIITNVEGKGLQIELEFRKGKSHSHPILAIWLETENGKYIQTLYVSESIAKGVFKHGDASSGRWLPGPVRRPSALPYWARKRNVQEDDGLYVPKQETAIPDAYTGPTPKDNFDLKSRSDQTINSPFKVMLEINQSFDYNEFWTTTRFANDRHYSASAQPSLIYESEIIDPKNLQDKYYMKVIGHGHFNGSNGKLFPDLSGHTTALEIVKSLVVRIRL